MKKFWIVVVFISLLSISACNAVSKTVTPTSKIEYAKSNLEREMAPKVESEKVAAFAESNTAFALSFYNHLRDTSDNIIFSPISLSLALSMAMAGAENNTETEMMTALKFTMLEEEIYPAFNALLLAIEESQTNNIEEREGSNFQLNIANSIWGQTGYGIKDSFLDTLAINYGAGYFNVDFMQQPEDAREDINNWVEQETNDKIQDLIPPGAINTLTRLVLANAIYFNGAWLYPFNEEVTKEAPFTLLDNSEITVDMMSLAGETLLYTHGDNYQAVQIPYLSRDFVMTLLVPDKDANFEFENKLNPEFIYTIQNNMNPIMVELMMPKFDFESTINANEILKSLGMIEAFSIDNADFTGITEDGDLFITDVLHKAIIEVNEAGTEAAAATAVIMEMKSAPGGDTVSLVIDRPFLFMIQHQPTGTVLFMGSVREP